MCKRTLGGLLILAAVLVFSAACGGTMTAPRNGTHRSGGMISETWVLSGTNNITKSTIGGLLSSSGTWRISGDTFITEVTMLGSTTRSTYTITDITRNSFRINGDLFERQ